MKQIDITVRTTDHTTYRVEVEDDFDIEDAWELEDIEESPIVFNDIKEYVVINSELVEK